MSWDSTTPTVTTTTRPSSTADTIRVARGQLRIYTLPTKRAEDQGDVCLLTHTERSIGSLYSLSRPFLQHGLHSLAATTQACMTGWIRQERDTAGGRSALLQGVWAVTPGDRSSSRASLAPCRRPGSLWKRAAGSGGAPVSPICGLALAREAQAGRVWHEGPGSRFLVSAMPLGTAEIEPLVPIVLLSQHKPGGLVGVPGGQPPRSVRLRLAEASS